MALTNRQLGEQPEDERARPTELRSRGLLCHDALKLESARTALDWADHHLGRERYNPFNLLLIDAHDGYVVHGTGHHRIVQLEPGLHILSETDVDDVGNCRVSRAFELLRGKVDDHLPSAETVLKSVLVEHGDEARPQEWMCRHLKDGGTVSSVVLSASDCGLNESRYLYAPGPPCTHPYQDQSALLRHGPSVVCPSLNPSFPA